MRDSSTHRQKVSPSMPTSGGGRDFLICISAVQGRRFAEGADPEHSTFSEFCVFGAVRVRVGHVFAEVHFNAWVVGKESLFQPRGTVQHVLSFSHFRKSRPCLTAGLLPVRLVLSV